MEPDTSSSRMHGRRGSGLMAKSLVPNGVWSSMSVPQLSRERRTATAGPILAAARRQRQGKQRRLLSRRQVGEFAAHLVQMDEGSIHHPFAGANFCRGHTGVGAVAALGRRLDRREVLL